MALSEFLALSLLLSVTVSGTPANSPPLTGFHALLGRCCSIGTTWATNHTSCTGPPWPIPEISANDRMACATAIYICCIKYHRVAQCERGKLAARNGQMCSALPVPGGETYKDCCDGCSLGLKASSLRMRCSSNLAFGSPWEEAYDDCCINATPNEGTLPLSRNRCETEKPCSQICENKGTSIQCSCYAGYHLLADQRTCEDINECEHRIDTCNHLTESCVNAIGGFQCVPKGSVPGHQDHSKKPGGGCPVGYQENPLTQTCDDVDECATGVCNRNTEICVNTIGSYTCTPHSVAGCQPGFKQQQNTGRCIDVDECSENIHGCNRELELCINSYGGYHCETVQGRNCPAGFKWDDDRASCEDVNECTEHLDDCDSKQDECRNFVGGYECNPRCPLGMWFDELQDKCTDIDECIESLHDCRPGEICLNTSPNYRCLSNFTMPCPPGYKPSPVIDGNPPSCVDVDECAEELHACDQEKDICINAIGSYSCVPKHSSQEQESCPPGYRFHEDTCEDINECETGQHTCIPGKEQCINVPGGFRCQQIAIIDCPRGYIYNSSTNICDDIDECSRNMHNCLKDSQVCVNMFGGFRCFAKPSCIPGFTFNVEKSACVDVNECAERPDVCNRDNERCINTEGSYRCENVECPAGFRRRIQGEPCQDINECAERPDICNRDSERCINTEGSYRCASAECPPGYRRRVPGGSCEDVNECTDQTDDCDKSREYCVNTPGSFQCHSRSRPITPKCGIGYRHDISTGNCKDINECEEIRPCLPDQTCENNPGSYRCVCQQGFTMDLVTRTCRDVNECQLGLHSCIDSQRCDNTIGSFTCVRTTSCGTGYTLNAGTNKCEDDNECLLGTHNCAPSFVCRNTAGSFRCDRVRCPHGQRLLTDGSCQVITCGPGTELDPSGNCVDINECALGTRCRANQRCVNSVGSYKCVNLMNCGTGYELNELGTQCVDIDECSRRTHDCTSEQVCRNRPGSYSCECPPGYSLNAQRICEDIDECTRFRGQICSASSECHNTPGSYICNCKPGFKKTEDGRNCEDMDECADSPNICHQKCFNIWGSYKCLCEKGYTLASDGRSCQDIDECALFEGRGNLCIGFCVNVPGSYSCSCPDGYRISSDQRTCQDIDECQEQNVCKGQNEVCLNTRGGFKCNVITCPPNYERDRDHRNRCKRSSVECRQGDPECLKEPLSISYNYITFVSKMRIPPSGQLDLFTMRGPRFTFTTVEFALELKDARAGYGTVAATREYFHLRRTAFNEAMVSLVRSIPGPQEVELELTMKMYHNGLFGGIAVARIFIFVTAHEF